MEVNDWVEKDRIGAKCFLKVNEYEFYTSILIYNNRIRSFNWLQRLIILCLGSGARSTWLRLEKDCGLNREQSHDTQHVL